LLEVAEPFDTRAEHDDHVGRLAVGRSQDVREVRRYDHQATLRHGGQGVAETEEHRAVQHVEELVRQVVVVRWRPVGTGSEDE